MLMYVWSKLSSPKWRDAWEEIFQSSGQTNAVITEFSNRKTIRVDVYCAGEKDAGEIRERYGGSVRKLKNMNWAAMVPPTRTPLVIRDRLVISNSSNPKEVDKVRRKYAGRNVLQIPPELAFGTGDHATTSTCLRLLADEAKRFEKEGRSWSMADAGCGTGVLALAARLLGAKPVHGFDFDPMAVKVARTNAERNAITGVKWSVTDVLKWTPPRKYECICANIFANILIPALPLFRSALSEDGALLLSGVLDVHWNDLERALDKNSFELTDVRPKGKWTTARAIRA